MNEKKYTIEEITVLNVLNNSTDRLTANKLVGITSIKKRRLHEIISNLQAKGELIIANKEQNKLGYMIARTSSDLDAYFKQAQRQIDTLELKINGMKANAHKVDAYKEQLNQQLKQD